eukprot:COSAG06_NODE_5959_length_3183_cov_6.510376_3_plen_71_part_00
MVNNLIKTYDRCGPNQEEGEEGEEEEEEGEEEEEEEGDEEEEQEEEEPETANNNKLQGGARFRTEELVLV